MMRAGLALLLIAVASLGCVTYERGACGSLFEAPLPRAVDDAIASAPGANALMDASYGMENLCLVVRGRAVQIP